MTFKYKNFLTYSPYRVKMLEKVDKFAKAGVIL
jgi:hypothetical protein